MQQRISFDIPKLQGMWIYKNMNIFSKESMKIALAYSIYYVIIFLRPNVS